MLIYLSIVCLAVVPKKCIFLLYISILEFQGGRIKNDCSFKVKVVRTFLICNLVYDGSSLQDDMFESFHVEV